MSAFEQYLSITILYTKELNLLPIICVSKNHSLYRKAESAHNELALKYQISHRNTAQDQHK